MGKVIDITQGDIVLVGLDPTLGREQGGVRPAVIVSADAFHFSGMTLACPLTTKIKNFVGDPIISPNNSNGLTAVSEVLVGQIRSISIDRVSKRLGAITKKQLGDILRGFDLLCDRD